MLRSCDRYLTMDSLRTYLLELFDVHEIENLSYVAKRQKIMYNDTTEYHHWGVCGWSMQTGQILVWAPLHQNQSSNISRKLQVNSTRRQCLDPSRLC